VNYAISKVAGRKSEAEVAAQAMESAVREMGLTSRHSIDAMRQLADRVVTAERSSVRDIVSPVGRSCNDLQIGRTENGALLIDASVRNEIEATKEVTIGREAAFEIRLSELDLVNRTCKFAMRGEEDTERRVSGVITDPVLDIPNNTYSASLNDQKWLSARGKPEITPDGDISRVFISDAHAIS
jgi:hypothetical protein